MARRKIRDWNPDEKVADATVAPARYTDDLDTEFRWTPRDERKFPTFREVRAAVPYQPGEVFYVEGFDYKSPRDEKGYAKPKPKLARVIDILFEYQRDGDKLEVYVAQYETAKGIWAKVGTKVYPGYVQRGYKQAAALGLI
jgi:hypothetical protein